MDNTIFKFAPIVSSAVVAGCALFALNDYKLPDYEYLVPQIIEGEEKVQKLSENISENKNSKKEKPKKGAFELKDGKYQGTGTGFKGEIKVSVEIKDRSIQKIKVLSSHDDPAFFNRATALLDTMKQQQSYDVDVITGATYSSKGLKAAVKNALTGEVDITKPAGSSSSKSLPKVKKFKNDGDYEYKDGDYTGSAQGFAGQITVKVKIRKGKISKINILKYSDGVAYIAKAKKVISAIIKKQSTNVDTISSATYSSAGIINAVGNALDKAKLKKDTSDSKVDTQDETKDLKDKTNNDSKIKNAGKFPYKNGTYKGKGYGFRDEIEVALTIKDKTITSIEVLKSSDDEPFFSRASELLNTIIVNQNIRVDVVTGASFSSRGLLEAVEDALNTAKKISKKNNSSSDNKTNDSSGDSKVGESDNELNNNNNDSDEDINKKYINGTYSATSICYPDEYEDFDPYNITVTVVIEGDKIIKVPSIVADYTDPSNEGYFSWAINGRGKNTPGMIYKIVKCKNLDNIKQVDIVSNATCSSNAIKNACQQAISKAKK